MVANGMPWHLRLDAEILRVAERRILSKRSLSAHGGVNRNEIINLTNRMSCLADRYPEFSPPMRADKSIDRLHMERHGGSWRVSRGSGLVL